jgi:hypothetical protein
MRLSSEGPDAGLFEVPRRPAPLRGIKLQILDIEDRAGPSYKQPSHEGKRQGTSPARKKQ